MVKYDSHGMEYGCSGVADNSVTKDEATSEQSTRTPFTNNAIIKSMWNGNTPGQFALLDIDIPIPQRPDTFHSSDSEEYVRRAVRFNPWTGSTDVLVLRTDGEWEWAPVRDHLSAGSGKQESAADA